MEAATIWQITFLTGEAVFTSLLRLYVIICTQGNDYKENGCVEQRAAFCVLINVLRCLRE